MTCGNNISSQHQHHSTVCALWQTHHIESCTTKRALRRVHFPNNDWTVPTRVPTGGSGRSMAVNPQISHSHNTPPPPTLLWYFQFCLTGKLFRNHSKLCRVPKGLLKKNHSGLRVQDFYSLDSLHVTQTTTIGDYGCKTSTAQIPFMSPKQQMSKHFPWRINWQNLPALHQTFSAWDDRQEKKFALWGPRPLACGVATECNCAKFGGSSSYRIPFRRLHRPHRNFCLSGLSLCQIWSLSLFETVRCT